MESITGMMQQILIIKSTEEQGSHGASRLLPQVVKARGESMAAAAKQGRPHGMLSIIGLEDGPLGEICAKVRAKLGGDVVCQLANYLFPTGA